MVSYRIVIKNSAAKEIEKIQKKIGFVLLKKSDALRAIHNQQAVKNFLVRRNTESDKETTEFCTRLSITN